MRRIRISTADIRLSAFLKWAGITATGGAARALLESGAVSVNGMTETRRGRRLLPGDVVRVGAAEELAVVAADGD